MTEFPVRVEREVSSEAPVQVYRAVAELFRRDGYAVQEEGAPEESATAFRAGFRAVRDDTLDGARRRQGYLMLAAGALITVAMLVVYALDLTDNRILASAPLLPAVILGGLGLSRLQEPARRARRLVEARFESKARAGVTQVTLLAGIGTAEGKDSIGEWLGEGEVAPFDEERLDALLERFRPAA